MATGSRWRGSARDDRIRALYVEDQSHFLKSCDVLKDERFGAKQLINFEDENFHVI